MPNPIPPPSSSDQSLWIAVDDLSCSPCGIDPETLVRAASIVADNLSGHQFGLRVMRLRPQAVSPSCHCRIGCNCGRMTEVLLDEPIWSISEVKVDGETLASDAWILYHDNRLVRVDHGTFPCCQNLARDPGADLGTLEISCAVGSQPDAMAQLAVNEIACELAKSFDDPENCRLPRKTQSFTRQQLSVSVLDTTTSYADGFIGLPTVDIWLASLDADSRRRPGRVVDLSHMSAWRESAS